MSSSSKPPPGKGKPFLPDDDLLNELDAWDATPVGRVPGV